MIINRLNKRKNMKMKNYKYSKMNIKKKNKKQSKILTLVKGLILFTVHQISPKS